MVLSKLNKKINYVEIKRINNDDLNRECDLYEMKILSTPVLIAIGKQNNSYIDKGVVYFPIYLIKYNSKSIQIGIYEVDSKDVVKYVDDIDIETFDKPLLYSFVNKDFLEKTRLNPKTDVATDKTEVTKVKTESKDAKVKTESKVKTEPVKEEVKEVNKSEDNPIQEIRKPYFSIMPGKEFNSLPVETEESAKALRGRFENTEENTWVQRFFRNTNYSIQDNEGSGDCFFYAVRDAFLTIGQETSVAKLRDILASKATEEKYVYYRDLYEQYSSNASELKEEAKKLRAVYEDIQAALKKETSKDAKVALLKKGKEVKEERNTLVEQYDSLQPLIRDVKFISNVPNFKHFKSKLRTSHYWADSWSIGIIEKELNIKFVVLSSDHYSHGDMEIVLNCAITDVTQLIDTEAEVDNFYEPDYYIILEHTGTHYRLIGYKDKYIFEFKELPYDLKQMIINKCMEYNSIYNYIPDFIQMKKQGIGAKGKTTADKIQQMCDARLYDLFDENIEFVYHSKSRSGMPGKMSGEKIPDKEIKHFLTLNKIPNWRKKLSNDWVEPFVYDKHRWASVSHLMEASKYKSNPRKYIQYSMDSGSELSTNVNFTKSKEREPGYNKLLQEALLAKWSLPEMKKLLLETKKAKLSEFVRGEEPDPSCILMDVRDKLRKNMQ